MQDARASQGNPLANDLRAFGPTGTLATLAIVGIGSPLIYWNLETTVAHLILR